MASSDSDSQTPRRPKTPSTMSRKNSSEYQEPTAPMPLRPKTPINYRKLSLIGLDSDSDEVASPTKTPKRVTKKRKNSSSSSETPEADNSSSRPKAPRPGQRIIQENAEITNGSRTRPPTPESPQFIYNQANGEVSIIPSSSLNSVVKDLNSIPNRPKTPITIRPKTPIPNRPKTPIPNRPKTPVNKRTVFDTPGRSDLPATKQSSLTSPLILFHGMTARMSTSRPIIAKVNALLTKQPEVELIPRQPNEQQKSPPKSQIDDAVTITPFSRSHINIDVATDISKPSTSKQTEPPPKPERKRRKSEIVERNFDDDIEKVVEEDEENDKVVEKKEEDIQTKKRKKTRDEYCWKCHKNSTDMLCNACPRVYHKKCVGRAFPTTLVNQWVCGECAGVLKADNVATRSPLMANITVDQLCMALKYIVGKMEAAQGSEPFHTPVDTKDVPDYLDYIIKPMDLSLLKHYVTSKTYGSTEAFMADAKWILHNCVVFNTTGGTHRDGSKLSTIARQLIKIAREEVAEFECCPMCYLKGRHLPRMNYTWFNDACNPPHMLVWAKLKGFPFWPAKVMPRTNHQGYIDVKFFGEHNRAWVMPKDIFLFSKEPPSSYPKSKQHDMQDSLREIDIHIRRLGETFGKFTYAEPKTLFDPENPQQIKLLLPDYDPPENIYFMMNNVASSNKGRRAKVAASEAASDTISETTVDSDNEPSADEDEEQTEEVASPKPRRGGFNGRGTRGIRGAIKCRITGKIIKKPPSVRTRGGLRGRGRGNWGPRPQKSVALKSTSVSLQRIVLPKSRRNASDHSPRTTRSATKEAEKDEKSDEPIASRLSEPSTSKEEVRTSAEPRRDKARKSFPNRVPPNAPGRTKNDDDQKPADPKVTYHLPAVDAGPLSSLLNRGANDLAKQMAMIMQESVKKAMEDEGPLSASIDAHQAHIYSLKLEIERMKWTHSQEIAEIKHNADKSISEMRATFECDKARALAELKATMETEKAKCIRDVKKKQWCIPCGKEARLWCCWNVSYCSHSCQEAHWRHHQYECKRINHSSKQKSGESSKKMNGRKEEMEAVPIFPDAHTNPSKQVQGA